MAPTVSSGEQPAIGGKGYRPNNTGGVKTPPPPSPENMASEYPGSFNAAARLDEILVRMRRCVKSRAGTDGVLLFLLYATRFLSNILESTSTSVLFLSSYSSKSEPAALGYFGHRLARWSLQAATHSRAAFAMIADFRAFGRLWGLMGIYFSFKKLVRSSSAMANEDEFKRESGQKPFDSVLSLSQLFSMLCFYFADNANCLSRHQVLQFSPITRKKLVRWSMRSWTLFNTVELLRSIVKRSSSERGVSVEGPANQILKTLAWLSIGLHNSVDNGPLDEFLISLLGLYASVWRMADLWRDSATPSNEEDESGQGGSIEACKYTPYL